jgi:peptide chain release factor subunit 1
VPSTHTDIRVETGMEEHAGLRSLQDLKVKRTLNELSQIKGRGTELISLYIPPKKALSDVINELRNEWGTASNIKSDVTRAHVQDALTKIMQRLKLYERPPSNGLIIFAGALPRDGPGSEAVRIFEIVPPKPVQIYLYRCDDHFHLEPLKELLRHEKIYGLISIDATEAGLAIISGENVQVLDVITSGVGGKTRKGGQSARRYEREREMYLTYYFQRVAEYANKYFLNDFKVEGIIIAGPGYTKDEFLKAGYLNYQLKNKIIATLNTSYAGREGVRELIDKLSDIMTGVRVFEEKRLMDKLLKALSDNPHSVVFDPIEILDLIDKGLTQLVLVSENVDRIYMKIRCKNCNNEEKYLLERSIYTTKRAEIVGTPCKICGFQEKQIIEESELIELLERMAIQHNIQVEVISKSGEAGQILMNMGGMAAILRAPSNKA